MRVGTKIDGDARINSTPQRNGDGEQDDYGNEVTADVSIQRQIYNTITHAMRVLWGDVEEKRTEWVVFRL